MGKWVVCAKHPSNVFFEQFPNCLTFRNNEEFIANVSEILTLYDNLLRVEEYLS